MWTGEVDTDGALPVGEFTGDHGDSFSLRVRATELEGFDWTDFTWVAQARAGRKTASVVATFDVTDSSAPDALDVLLSLDDTLDWEADTVHYCDLQSATGSPIHPFTVARWTMFPARDVTREA